MRTGGTWGRMNKNILVMMNYVLLRRIELLKEKKSFCETVAKGSQYNTMAPTSTLRL